MTTENQETLHVLDYWRVILGRKEIIIAVFLIVVTAGVLFTYQMPKVYVASAVIAVKEESPDVKVWGRERTGYDPLFLRTQFEIIQSRPVLEDATRRLNLNEKLGRAYGYLTALGDKSFERTLKILAGAMKVQQYRDTNLIEIQIELSEPKESAPREAADTANMIASVYRSQSILRSREATERALEALHKSFKERELKVSEAERALDEVRLKYKISIVSPMSSESSGQTLDNVAMSHLEGQLIQERLNLEEKKARYEKVRDLPKEELLDVAAYVVGDPALAALVAQKRRTQVERERLLEDAYGPKHPNVVAAQAVIDELATKIDEALNGLMAGVEADYEAAQAKFKALQEMLEDMKTSDMTAQGEGYREFNRAFDDLAHAKRIRNALEIRYVQEQIELQIPRTTVEMIEPAKPSEWDEQVRPNVKLNVVLSIILGLGAGIGLAFFIEYMDTSVKTVEDIERHMQVPVLGVIPQKVGPLVEESEGEGHAEAYRVLRANIQFSKKLKVVTGGQTFCVTSGGVGEGKSLTLFNLAYTCARLGDRALIVDSDLHRPRQHKILGVSNDVGLANILVGEVGMADAIVDTGVKDLSFLPSGKLTSGVHGLLDNTKMRDLMIELRGTFDYIYFDAPPMLGISDASLLVREMDAVLLVVQHRRYPRAVSNRAKEMVENVGGNLVGVVLNNINVSRDYSYYYHHYYYYYPKQYGETRKS